jgi:hypothetical protein
MASELEPDFSRLSNAFKTLSDEIPLLANLESAAILRLLDDLRQDLRRNMETNDNLGTLLEGKLTGIQEALNSMDARLYQLEASIVPRIAPRDQANLSSTEVADAVQLS